MLETCTLYPRVQRLRMWAVIYNFFWLPGYWCNTVAVGAYYDNKNCIIKIALSTSSCAIPWTAQKRMSCKFFSNSAFWPQSSQRRVCIQCIECQSSKYEHVSRVAIFIRRKMKEHGKITNTDIQLKEVEVRWTHTLTTPWPFNKGWEDCHVENLLP